MQENYTIKVNTDAINAAQVNNEWHCPIAYAIARDLDATDGTEASRVRVTTKQIAWSVAGQRYRLVTPPRIARWLNLLDSKGKKAVRAFQFELVIANAVVKEKAKANPARVARPSKYQDSVQPGRNTIRNLSGARSA
jgi:hypothetical protein